MRRFASLIKPGGTVLDVACGSGRHLRWLAAQGLQVTGVDRDAAALAPLAGLAEVLVADMLQDDGVRLPGARRHALLQRAQLEGLEVPDAWVAAWQPAAATASGT